MGRFSLYSLIFVLFAVLLLGVILVVYFTMNAERKTLIDLEVREKTNLTEAISGIMGSTLWQGRQGIVTGINEVLVSQTLNFEGTLFFRIVEANGKVFQSTIKEDFGKIIEDSVIKTEETVIRDETFQEKPIKVLIYPGSMNRTYWVGFTLESIEEKIRAITFRNLIVGLGFTSLVFLILFLITGRIIRPIKKLTLYSQEIAKGNFNVKAEVKSKTEIGELASAFNQMVIDLKKSHTYLEEAKTTLEVKVEARTKELKELADNLDEQVKERTKEVQEKMKELERFNKMAVGRELKMVELKKEIDELKKS